jgi:CheY-like chemotaxis protein
VDYGNRNGFKPFHPGGLAMSPTAARKLRVLIADKHQDAANSLVFLAGLWGHEARAVYNSQDAVSNLKHFRPDVVILDLTLPGLRIDEIAEDIRRQPEPRAMLLGAAGFTADWVSQRLPVVIDGYLRKLMEPEMMEQMLAAAPRLPGP